MRNFIHLIVIALYAIILHSCALENSKAKLIIDNAGLNVKFLNAIPHAGGSSEVKFESSLDWTITTSDTKASSWLDASPSSGGPGTATVTITAAKNTTPDDRESKITITTGSLSEEIRVFQLREKLITLRQKRYEIDRLGGRIKVEISSNINYEVKMPDVNWIKEEVVVKAISNHTLYFEVAENSDIDFRSTVIIFKNSDEKISETLTINQVGTGYGYYNSTDYSQDGTVLTLQTASSGTGINLVIVGDGFSDKDMGTNGKYEERMSQAMNHFFSEEPLKTYRDHYNVYTVKAVSRNEVYDIGSRTIFECEFGDGTLISGNDEKVFEYALKVPTMRSHNDLTIITVLNSPKYAGTCYMYTNNASIAYCPIVYFQDESYRQIVTHEAAGHGFAKLGDEYYYSGSISPEMILAYKEYKDLDWLANTDFTDNPSTISWAHILSDSRYANEIGIFEGALGYIYGTYRPTEFSIMRSNIGGFNAPSREAIFKRIMILSGGSYSYEDFVTYDAKNRTSSAITARRAQAARVDQSKFVPLSPPVFIWGSPKAVKF